MRFDSVGLKLISSGLPLDVPESVDKMTSQQVLERSSIHMTFQLNEQPNLRRIGDELSFYGKRKSAVDSEIVQGHCGY